MTRTPDCGCKVGRAVERFGLEDLNGELAARRRGETGRPASLRDLADHVNREVLRSALAEAGKPPLDGEAENTYRLLRDDDVGSSMRLRARKRLEREGVDVAAVEGSFVSHPTVGTHLEDCLGVEKPPTGGDRTGRTKERMFKVQSRAEAVTEDALDGLVAGDEIAAGELTVTVDVRVACEECGVYERVDAFVDRGGCDCGGT